MNHTCTYNMPLQLHASLGKCGQMHSARCVRVRAKHVQLCWRMSEHDAQRHQVFVEPALTGAQTLLHHAAGGGARRTCPGP